MPACLGAVGPIWLTPSVLGYECTGSTGYSTPAGRPAGVVSTRLLGRTYAFDLSVFWLQRAVSAWGQTWHP